MVAAMQNTIDKSRKYCEEMVKKDDHDRYLTTLFISSEYRHHVLALYAFNQEVAKTQESVSEPMIGEIRLQWWREAVDQILEGHIREHPVVESLAQISAFKEIAPLLQEIIDARQSDLYQQSSWSIEDLVDYAGKVGGALSEAVLTIATNPPETQRIVARNVIGIIRALPFHENEDGIYSSFTNDGQSTDGIDFETLKPTIVKLIKAIEEYTVTEKSEIVKIEKNLRPLLLLNSATLHYQNRLGRLSLNPFRLAEQQVSDLPLLITLIWATLRGRF